MANDNVTYIARKEPQYARNYSKYQEANKKKGLEALFH